MKNKVLLIIFLTSILIYLGYDQYTAFYSDKGILNHVIQRDGYSLALKSERLPIEIFIKPEWIAFGPDERKELKIKVFETNHTSIYLDQVWNRGNDIYFSLHTTFEMNAAGGDFLYNGIFNEDGTFTTLNFDDIVLYDTNKDNIGVGQTGNGPNADFSFGIEPQNQKLIQEGFYVKYSGFNLYEYAKH